MSRWSPQAQAQEQPAQLDWGQEMTRAFANLGSLYPQMQEWRNQRQLARIPAIKAQVQPMQPYPIPPVRSVQAINPAPPRRW